MNVHIFTLTIAKNKHEDFYVNQFTSLVSDYSRIYCGRMQYFNYTVFKCDQLCTQCAIMYVNDSQ